MFSNFTPIGYKGRRRFPQAQEGIDIPSSKDGEWRLDRKEIYPMVRQSGLIEYFNSSGSSLTLSIPILTNPRGNPACSAGSFSFPDCLSEPSRRRGGWRSDK